MLYITIIKRFRHFKWINSAIFETRKSEVFVTKTRLDWWYTESRLWELDSNLLFRVVLRNTHYNGALFLLPFFLFVALLVLVVIVIVVSRSCLKVFFRKKQQLHFKLLIIIKKKRGRKCKIAWDFILKIWDVSADNKIFDYQT